jgi:hypothetical protein
MRPMEAFETAARPRDSKILDTDSTRGQTESMTPIPPAAASGNRLHFPRPISKGQVHQSAFAVLLFLAFSSLGFGEGIHLPKIKKLQFQPHDSAVLIGSSGERHKKQRNPDIAEADRIGDFGILSLWYQNAAYTDGKFNHNDFRVEAGTVQADGFSFPAYRVHPPARKASKWLASSHIACLRFQKRGDYTVHELLDDQLVALSQVQSRQIIPRTFLPLRDIPLSELTSPKTLVVVPDSANYSSFHPHGSEGVAGATLHDEGGVKVTELRVKLPGTPFDTAKDFPHGPSSWQNQYTPRRRFFPVTNADGSPGVVWQDRESQQPYVTWLGKRYAQPRHFELPNKNNLLLAAATSDASGAIYMLLVGDGDGAKEDSRRTVEIARANAEGKQVAVQALDSSKNGLNITAFGEANTASLVWNGAQLGLIFSRTMHRSGDGLNHQGAIGLVLDPMELAVIKNHGQTSGHSFDNQLTLDSEGRFLGIDLGDAYPRGIHLHRFDAEKRDSSVVYSFKTYHSDNPTRAGKTFHSYDEISKPGDTRFKWSNDTSTYTELAGAIPGIHGIAVVFAGERAPDGRTMDNARAADRHFDPRNLAVILARSDFENLDRLPGSCAPEGLALSAGKTEDGGFYDFGGNWQNQRHEGVVWLTDYDDSKKQNASRLKAFPLAGDRIGVVWEEWTAEDYTGTRLMHFSAEQLADPTFRPPTPLELPSRLRLGRRDDPFLTENQVVFYSGSVADQMLVVHLLELKK